MEMLSFTILFVDHHVNICKTGSKLLQILICNHCYLDSFYPSTAVVNANLLDKSSLGLTKSAIVIMNSYMLFMVGQKRFLIKSD